MSLHHGTDRLQRLLWEVRVADAQAIWVGGITGLRLNVDLLKELGASAAFLERWENGCCLQPRAGARDNAPEEERVKVRIIMDLSRSSLNASLPDLPVNYGAVDLAISRMFPRSFLYVVDLADAFCNWRVLPSDAWWLGFWSPGRQQCGMYTFLPFGLKTAPSINDSSLKELLRLLQLHENAVLTDFVDDNLGAQSSEEDAWLELERVVRFFLEIGVPISAKEGGIRPPSQVQTWVGWVFDTLNNTLSVQRTKCDKCQALILAALQADSDGTLLARDLAATAGLANHIAEVFLQGRRRLYRVWASLNAANVYALWARRPAANPVVHLSPDARETLRWWHRALDRTPERPLHGEAGQLSLWGPKSPEFQDWRRLAAAGCLRVIETDASKLRGWSYNLCSAGVVRSGVWPAGFADLADNADAINFKELWVAVQAVQAEPEWLRGWRVVFRIDNTAAIHYVNFRSGRIPHLVQLAEEFEHAERSAGCWCLAVHLAGAANVISDSGSRDSAFASRWNAGPFREAVLKASAMDRITNEFGPFDCDLFADRLGVTAKAPLWFHPENTAFEAHVLGNKAEATEWFKTAIRQGGALEAAFAEAVKSVLQADVASDVGEIPTAIKATAETFETQNGHTDTVIASLEQRVIACEEFVAKASKQEADLDAAFSWREVERSTDAQEWLAGWNRLFVDKDWLANVSAQMADPAMVNAVSVCMANPNNPDAQKIKDAIGLRNAPKTTLRELCLSSFGGSPDRFRAFMSDKAAARDDKVVAAIARKALGFFLLLENQHVNAATAKPTSAAKLTAQRNEIMPLLFVTLKAMRRKAKKASARNSLEHIMLCSEFSLDWSLGLSRLAVAPFVMAPPGPAVTAVVTSGSPEGAPGAVGGPAYKRLRADPAQGGGGAPGGNGSWAPQQGLPQQHQNQPNSFGQNTGKGGKPQAPGTGKGGNNNHKKANVTAMLSELGNMVGRQQPAAVQAFVDANHQGSPDDKEAIRSIMGTYCRHCLLGSRRLVQHSRAQCRQEGGVPATPCSRCAQKGIVAFHWQEE
ncbi:unnamed protein product, partial [Prorocentrum cordatum]